MADEAVEIPIFELPLVLLPGELVPLHIFEERYKAMIGHCLDHGEPFGIVFRDPNAGARRIGCEARITEVTERFDDGRLNIVVTGERPFRVLDRHEAGAYPAGEVEPLRRTLRRETDCRPRGGGAAPRRRLRRAGRAGRRRTARDAELEALDSYGIAAKVELPTDTKQHLLELRSEPERMKVLAAALDALVETLSRSTEIAERARMNGKVSISPRDSRLRRATQRTASAREVRPIGRGASYRACPATARTDPLSMP